MEVLLYEKIKRKLKTHIQRIDKITLFLVVVLIFVGWVSTISISPSVARNISLQELSFIKKQTVFSVISLILIVAFSVLSVDALSTVSIFICILFVMILFFMPFVAIATKGSKRWLSIFGFSVQPSEILKPFFLVVNGLILRRAERKVLLPFMISVFLMLVVAILLFLQPDIGMAIIYSVAWIAQLFLSNIPIGYVVYTIVSLFALSIIPYLMLDHVRFRVQSFWHLGGAITPYQVKASLASMSNGGLWGTGLGEGQIKKHLPDAHSDYIFAAIGEEIGWIMAMVLVVIYASIVLRNTEFFMAEKNAGKRIIGMGIVSILFVHIVFSIGVSVNLLPSKGTTLPFLSYGGSSMISFGILVGVLLSLTKDQPRFMSIFESLRGSFLGSSKSCDESKE